MAAEPRVTKTDIIVETQNTGKRVTRGNISVETVDTKKKRVTTAGILVETQTITDMAKHVTSVIVYLEWNYPPSKYTVQMI